LEIKDENVKHSLQKKKEIQVKKVRDNFAANPMKM